MTLAGRKVVTSAGTAVRISDDEPVPMPGRGFGDYVIIKALATNTGIVYLGDSATNAAAAVGFPLTADDSVRIDVSNLNQLWIDAAVNGEGIAWAKGLR